MNNKYFLSYALGVFLPVAASAGSMGAVSNDWQWVGTLSGGASWTSVGKDDVFYLTPDIEKAYMAEHSTRTLGLGELFIGAQKQLPFASQGQLGVAVAVSGNARVNGFIWDDASPKAVNHSYSYKLFHSHVAVKGKLLKDFGYWVAPWVSGSIGVGFNSSYGFRNTPLIFAALPNPNFSNHTQTAFTYTVGAGIQRAVNEHWTVGVGYEFADWGKSELGLAPEQLLDNHLKLNHLYSNGVLFNITYLS